MAEVCHIRAESPGGPRYDASQTDEERHGFDNLIILCRNHHRVIDVDTASWTVDKLVALKKQHEASAIPLPEPSAEVIMQLLTTVSVQVGIVSGGSVITTVNQTGGQVAHQIVNHGPPRRLVPNAEWDRLVSLLSQHKPEEFVVCAPMNFDEARQLGSLLRHTLVRAGWKSRIDDIGLHMGNAEPHRPGFVINVPAETPALRVLAIWAQQVGLNPECNLGIPAGMWPGITNIFVGPAPESAGT